MTRLNNLYYRLRRSTPLWMRLLLRDIGLTRFVRAWNPRNNANFAWPLRGMLEGHHVYLRQEEFWLTDKAQYEPEVCAAIVRLTKPGWICADVGGHIGYMTLLLAKLVGTQGHIYTFEALTQNADLVRRNVKLNGYQSLVTVENVAVSDGLHDKVELFTGPTLSEFTIVSSGTALSGSVSALALDNYFLPDQRLDLVKMDIEGGEVKALAGMRRLLTHTRPIIVLEIHDAGWAAIDELRQADYLFYDLKWQLINAIVPWKGINHCIAIPANKTAADLGVT